MSPIVVREIGSGVRVAVAVMPEAPTIAIEVAIRGGPLYESPNETGLSHLLEHAIFRGVLSQPDPRAHARAIDKLARHDEATDSNQIVLPFRCLPDDFEDLVALLGQTIREPSFTGLAIEQEVIVHEIHEDLDDDGQQIDAGTIAAAVLYGDHSLSQPIIGDEAHVRGFTLAALRAFHARVCCGANIVIGVAGDVDPESAIDSIEAAFFGLPLGERANRPPPPKAQQTKAELRIVEGSTYADLCLAFRGVGREDPRASACELLARVLDGERASGLLCEHLRSERARCYRVTTQCFAFDGAGHLEIQTRIRADQVVRVVREILEVLVRVARDGPDGETLAVVRRSLEREAAEAAHDAARVASAIASDLFDDEEPDDPTGVANLLAVTGDDVRDAARLLVRPENLVVVCVGGMEKTAKRLLEQAVAQWRPRTQGDAEQAPATLAG